MFFEAVQEEKWRNTVTGVTNADQDGCRIGGATLAGVCADSPRKKIGDTKEMNANVSEVLVTRSHKPT